ncbi:NHL repeat-containing protein [Pseudoduganella sp. RAF19]|uniref:NHL repeat-containing protein n=2 Tax=unclassified Pseudoduganella TaxID=2637179 RepID=UPI003F9A037C
MNRFEHITYYGELAQQGAVPRGELPADFTMNSPVGIARDNFGRVWVCDTGNSRVLVFTADLDSLLHEIYATPGADTDKRLLMPFHLCPHPEENLMYFTDMGNGRVVVYSYDEKQVDFSFAFGDAVDGINGEHFLPLSDPNGLTIVREKDGKNYLYVCDEFFHTKNDDRSRCVKFTPDGKFVLQFRTVQDPGHKHDLLWPQGIASDAQGRLYLANTGDYEVLRIDTAWPVKDEVVQAPDESALLHSFGNPAGIGKYNVMRSVCVIGDKVFVPGQMDNAITVYSTISGKHLATIEGMLPLWNHKPQAAHSLSDFVYNALEDAVFVGPYQLAGAREPNVYYITEPFASTVLKVRIPAVLDGGDEDAILLDAVGHRRDSASRERKTSQFNCMSAVIGVDPHRKGAGAILPISNWLDGWASAAANVYQYWYDQVKTHSGFDPLASVGKTSYNLDSGNWCLKSFDTAVDPMTQMQNMVRGLFAAGDLAMAVYYPSQPLLGQVCPGTPVVFITNFTTCTVSMYQYGPNGHLLNYGIPFGREGDDDGALSAPQGLEVNRYGEIFIADSLNNRISKWQLQPSGLVSFVKNFRWKEKGKELATFAPCDVAIDKQDRVFVCDQFNNCIRVFDRDGNSLWSFGKSGYCDVLEQDYENFFLPASLCVDENNRLIVNDLVNRAFKVFDIKEKTLEFVSGELAFKRHPDVGGVWMPFFIYARGGRLYVPDTTFNVVNVYSY